MSTRRYGDTSAMNSGGTVANEYEPAAVRRPLLSSTWAAIAARLLVGVFVIAFWQLISGRLVSEVFLSKPTVILDRLVKDSLSLSIPSHLVVTLSEIAIGYIIGGLVGLLLGYIFGRSQLLSYIFEPYIMAFYSVPKIALAPLFIIWLGIGLWSKVAMVLLMVFFLVFFNTFSGIKAVNEELVQLAQVMGASGRQVARRVILPAAAPFIIVGFKTAVPYSVIGAIIGEFTASSKGIGYYILYAAGTFDSAGVFAGIAALVAVVFVINYLISRLEARLLRWKPEVETQVIV